MTPGAMNDDAQATTSVWMATANTPIQPRLRENIRTNVCIVGAGIAAGMTTAYLLAKEGRSVATTLSSSLLVIRARV